MFGTMVPKAVFGLFGLFLLSHAPAANTANILAVFPFPVKSDFAMHNALIKELVHKGHQITMITAISLHHLELGPQYTEVLIEPAYDNWSNVSAIFKLENKFKLSLLKFADILQYTEMLGLETTEHALKHPKVAAIINAKQTEHVYDLLLTSQFYQEAFLALAYKFNVPVVTTTTFGHANYMAQMTGAVMSWAVVPNSYMNHTDQMNFFERVENICASLYEDYYREFVYFPKMDALVHKYFSHLPIKFPSVSKMEKNLSLILLNSHSSLATLHSSADTMIPIGGIHIYPPEPLPQDLQEFLDGATDGVIYFNFGSNLESQDLPPVVEKIFRNVFANLKQRVLWKYENDSVPNMPANVLTKKWLPQNSILAHPNVKVFITHGGMFGVQESVYHGVPMLGLPVYFDQPMNMKKAAQDGYAIALDFKSLNEQHVMESLQSLIGESKYRTNVLDKSKLFRDRPISPRENAVYWIEYVMRHKGAEHLRSAGLKMSWFSYYMLDIATLVGCIFIMGLIVAGGVVRLKYAEQLKEKTH